ncbi:hypothetical protein DACRYDRAFT_13402 [Dacryopinax primogenitus]|uniref:Uncharacterized protein n=1 Tax=Dacryopinax primogenitus (strain DJM 731) TaxID=1858805 RepID=M5GEE3_DACPD|nr:uncharacterized protein DACRYDRAFT_13402 [Dacryopinax primogenitus]EJU05352.1 hypothetical protein DACRYDRAFT_13402 [Dacryopinax primogenitus]
MNSCAIFVPASQPYDDMDIPPGMYIYYDDVDDPVVMEGALDSRETEEELYAHLEREAQDCDFLDIFGNSADRQALADLVEEEDDNGLLSMGLQLHMGCVKFLQAQQHLVFALMKLMGTRELPLVHTLKLWGKTSLQAVRNPVREFTSTHGNLYYLSNLVDLISKDMANLITHAGMEFYPIVGMRELKEFYHGWLWSHKASDNWLTPMIKHKGQHWYVSRTGVAKFLTMNAIAAANNALASSMLNCWRALATG